MPSSDRDANSRISRTDIGRRYEDQAALFFKRQGYEILERNWRAGRKEIDLIVRNSHVVAFVEVKAAASERFGHPSEKVDHKKQGHLIEVARQFIAEKEITGVDLRFDVITFTGGNLEHYPGAFEATE